MRKLIYLLLIGWSFSCSELKNGDLASEKSTQEVLESDTLGSTVSNEKKEFEFLEFVDTTNFKNELLVDFFKKSTLEMRAPTYTIQEIDSIRIFEKSFYASSIVANQKGDKSSATAYRLLLTDSKKEVLYDTKFYDPECGVFEYTSDSLFVDSQPNSNFLIFALKAYINPCCGASEHEIITNFYFNPANNLEVFTYQSKFEYLDNDNCGDTIQSARKTLAEIESIDNGTVRLNKKYFTNGQLDSVKLEYLKMK